MDSQLTKSAERIVTALHEAGHEAFFAGGCVRDMIMGRTSDDVDIATSARPEEVMRIFPGSRAVGAAFGVVRVRKEDAEFEVATFRSEGPYSDGRHPDSVSFCDAETDVRRRDFTINGMLYDPVTERLLDHVGGREDIRRRLVRAIGNPDDRFGEDHLRMLRAARFAAKLEFEIDEATADSIRRHAESILRVSPERIAAELKIILTGPNPARALELMDELCLLEHVLPEVAAMHGVEQPDNLHPEGDVFVHTILCMKHLPENPPWTLALAALLHDAGKPVAAKDSPPGRFMEHERIGAEIAASVCRRLRLSNQVREDVYWLVSRHMCFKDADKMRLSTLKRLFANPVFPELAEVHRVDALASCGDLGPYEWVMKRFAEMPEEEVKPEPLINGHDLIDMGLKPGPEFSAILGKISEAQLEGQISTRDEALAMAARLSQETPCD